MCAFTPNHAAFRDHDPEVELGLIGLALAGPEEAEALRDIKAEWFYEPSYRVIWAAILRASPTCFVAVQDELLKSGRVDCVPTLRQAVDAAPLPSSLPWFKERLIRYQKKRVLSSMAQEIAEGTHLENLDEMASRLDTALHDIHYAQQAQKPPRSLAEFARMEVDPNETLLGKRYLCRGGAMLFVGPSGVGKSSASCQQDMLWSLGRPAFGINPSRPLRILAFQAENDDGDQAEMASGVVSGLRLTDADLEIVHRNTRYRNCSATDDAFLRIIEREVRNWRPDLLRLDPLNAFIGDDAKDPKAIAKFCRVGINRILTRYGCGCVVAHHTPKTNFRDTSKWSALDWAYAGAGGADLTNWARAVMVVDPVNLASGLFRFIGAKRGARLGWTQGDGEPAFDAHFAYSKDSGLIYWRNASEEEVLSASLVAKKVLPTYRDLLKLVPEFGELISKEELRQKAMADFGISERETNKLIRGMLASKSAFEHKQKRRGCRDEVLVGLHPPSPG